MTKRRDLISTIAGAAIPAGIRWVIAREGGSHTVYDLDGLMIPTPRHAEINELTARGIYKQCSDKLGRDWWRK